MIILRTHATIQGKLSAYHSSIYKTNSVPHYLSEALLDGLPVDDIPDGGEVLGLAVLVLEARQMVSTGKGPSKQEFLLVGVLPSVNTEQRLELADDGVLVLVRS